VTVNIADGMEMMTNDPNRRTGRRDVCNMVSHRLLYSMAGMDSCPMGDNKMNDKELAAEVMAEYMSKHQWHKSIMETPDVFILLEEALRKQKDEIELQAVVHHNAYHNGLPNHKCDGCYWTLFIKLLQQDKQDDDIEAEA
jgi:hypothetical protein